MRRHFLRQAPRLVLAEAGEDYLLLRLDVPDTSLLLDGKVRRSWGGMAWGGGVGSTVLRPVRALHHVQCVASCETICCVHL